MVETDLKRLEIEFGATADHGAFTAYRERSLADPKRFKPLEESARIYPKYFAPVVVAEPAGRSIRPMRYRVRPSWSQAEIPAKYNVFNARLDALEQRKTWRGLFMQRHGLLGFRAFYEWVKNDAGKKAVIEFSPEDRDLIWAPVLWDRWQGPDGEILESFAVITTEPPPEVEAMGHDRCPVFLKQQNIERWLTPQNHSPEDIYAILNDIGDVTYGYQWAA